MVDTKKEQEREELHRAIWAIADDLRGAVDGWDFKSYVLGTMFYRYISENIASYINQGEIDAGNPDFRYEDMSDAEAEQRRALSKAAPRQRTLAGAVHISVSDISPQKNAIEIFIGLQSRKSCGTLY